MPEFYVIFARKNAQILLEYLLPEKYFSRFFFFWGGARASCPPVSYAYGSYGCATGTQSDCWVKFYHSV